jgi:uncharacterized protein
MSAAYGASTPVVSMKETNGLSHRAVAPAWHTLVVLLALLCFSAVGAISPKLFPLGGWHSRASGYTCIIAFEWIIAAFIAWGVKRRDIHISDLVGGSWARPRDFFRDLGIAIAFLLTCGIGVVSGLGHLLKASPNAGVRSMLPHSGLEITLWVLMSLTAGFCEELIFRGYLQRQFAALTNSVWAAIVLQGIAFGAAHGYQGWKLMVVIAVYGSLFGVLAQWRRSLRPGMLTHFIQDGMGGLLARYLMR